MRFSIILFGGLIGLVALTLFVVLPALMRANLSASMSVFLFFTYAITGAGTIMGLASLGMKRDLNGPKK